MSVVWQHVTRSFFSRIACVQGSPPASKSAGAQRRQHSKQLPPNGGVQTAGQSCLAEQSRAVSRTHALLMLDDAP